MRPSPAQLRQYGARLSLRASFLEEEEKRLISSSSFARPIAEVLSGAGSEKDNYRKALANAQWLISCANNSLNRSEVSRAANLFAEADNGIKAAQHHWERYVAAGTKGAKRGALGFGMIAVAAATAITGGVAGYMIGGASMAIGLGAALGVHGAGGTLLYFWNDDEPFSSTLSSPDEAPKAKPKDIKSEQPTTYAPRDRQVLISEARLKLAQWRACRSDASSACSLPPDFGSFLIESETISSENHEDDELHEAVQSRWSEEAADFSAMGGMDGTEAVRTIMKRLFSTHLSMYVKKNARMSDFLKGAGGNCEAQVKLILSAMAAAQIRLAPSQSIGVQVFGDHVQVVIYDRKTNEVWDLMSGKTVNVVDAPIYDPHILYQAYLKGEDEFSPVADRDLIIVEPGSAGDGKGRKVFTNSKMRFPDGGNLFGRGQTPDRAYVPSPYMDLDGASDGTVSDLRPVAVTSLEQMPRFPELVRQLVSNQGWTIESTYDMHLVFKTQEQSRHFSMLATTEERRAFLIQLTQQALAETLAFKEGKNALAVVSDMNAAKKYSDAEFKRAVGFVESVFHSAMQSSVHLYVMGYSREERLAYDKHYLKGPVVALLRQRISRLRRDIANQPLMFVQLLNELSHEKRVELFALPAADADRKELQIYNTSIAAIIGNPQLVGVGASGRTGPASFIDINFVDNRTKPEAPIPDPASAKGAIRGTDERPEQRGKGKKDTLSVADDSLAPVRISAECMIDFMFKFEGSTETADTDGYVILKRWNSLLARELARLNRDGRYDEEFLRLYKLISMEYPPDEQTKFDRNAAVTFIGMDTDTGKPWRIPDDIQMILTDVNKRERKRHSAARYAMEKIMKIP